MASGSGQEDIPEFRKSAQGRRRGLEASARWTGHRTFRPELPGLYFPPPPQIVRYEPVQRSEPLSAPLREC